MHNAVIDAGIHCDKKRSRRFLPAREWRAVAFLCEAGINQRSPCKIFCKKQRFFYACFYSTVTDLARLRGLSTSVPLAQAVW